MATLRTGRRQLQRHRRLSRIDLRYPACRLRRHHDGDDRRQPRERPPTGVVNRSYTTVEDVPLSDRGAGCSRGRCGSRGGGGDRGGRHERLRVRGNAEPESNGGFTFTRRPTSRAMRPFTYRAVDAAAAKALPRPSRSPSRASTMHRSRTPNARATEDIAAFTVAARGVLANDTDPDGSTRTRFDGRHRHIGPAAAGTLTLNVNGSFTFRPALNFSGVASFTYNARDNGTPPATERDASHSDHNRGRRPTMRPLPSQTPMRPLRTCRSSSRRPEC